MAYEEESFMGSGDLYIDVFDEDGNRTGELDVGNAKEFSISAPSVEKKELLGYRQNNYGRTIKSVITKIEQELKFTLTDINRSNLALAMFGQDVDYSQSAGSNTSSPETVIAKLDKWSKLKNRNLDTASPPVVKDSSDTTTYTEGEDYEIDYQVGRIRALKGGSITDSEELHVGCTWLAQSGFEVKGLQVQKIEAFLRLVGKDQANSRSCEVIVYKAEITPSGDIGWLTDDFATLGFSAKIIDTVDGSWNVLFYQEG